MSGKRSVTLYRGYFTDGDRHSQESPTFVSASFERAVAESLARVEEAGMIGILLQQETPLERLFMTYLETAEMNRRFREAEAVLLHSNEKAVF